MKNYALLTCLTLLLCGSLSVLAQQNNEITTYSAIKVFLEEESFRKTGQRITLSLPQLVYYDYIEKITHVISTQGEASFLPDNVAPLVLKTIKKYGVVPDTLSTPLSISYEALYQDMLNRLKIIKLEDKWKEKDILSSLTVVLQSYLGRPILQVEGLSPIAFMQQKCQLIPDDYYCFVSYGGEPFQTRITFPIAQNYQQQPVFYNIDLDDYQQLIQKGLDTHFPIGLSMDYTEEGYRVDSCKGTIPLSEISSQRINNEARQARFDDESTTADMSIVLLSTEGMSPLGEVKATHFVSDDCQGQFTYSWDYLRLKSLYLWVHKEVAREVLDVLIK